jgi:hypothetical protein
MRTCVRDFAGSTRTQFRRALRSGDPVLVLTIAAELERVQLEEAFAIVLVLADANDARYEKAASRLMARAANDHSITRARTVATSSRTALSRRSGAVSASSGTRRAWSSVPGRNARWPRYWP